MRLLTRLSSTTLTILLLAAHVTSQQPRLRPPSSDFNIEIINLEGPFVAPVPGAGGRSGLVARHGLRRISAWKPSGEVPVEPSALRVSFWLEENAVRVEVTAYFGPIESGSLRTAEWEASKTAKVALRLVREDETVTISEIERFGIEPFMIRVLRAAPWNGTAETVNKTQALTVTSVAEERPDITVAVRNVSQKHIDCISWYSMENGRRSGGSGSAARLIPAGGVFEIRQRFDLSKTASSRVVVIAAIVFEDGSFEGEPDDAAQMAADLTGLRTQISKTIQIFKNFSTSSPHDSRTVFSRLKREIGALEEEPEPSVVNELVTRFATASEDMRNRRIKEILQNSLQAVNRKSRRQVWDFERQLEHSGGSDLGKWVSETIKELESMLGSNHNGN
ncbi:MAG TPA: hypothetical protein VFD48_05930 [Pyrinomonadaceae bacterium]|nr:hypothetical protein [Pyrinomonadaceae bacterium]